MHNIFKGGAAALLAFSACVVPVGGTKGSLATEAIPPGKGQLVLSWKGESPSRTVLGSTWAASLADAYELLILGAGGTKTVTLENNSGESVALDPGTYRVVVLAGIKRSSGSTTAYLVGSAWSDTVAIQLNQRTPVNLVIKPIDVSFGPAGAAYWKETLTLAAAGQSRNPHVGMSLAGASTTTRPRFKSLELWNGYKESEVITGTPDNWTATTTGLVPASGSSLTVGLVGPLLVLQDLTGAWVPTTGITTLSWSWPNRPDIAATHPLVGITEVIVPTGPPPTGAQVSLAWE